MFKYIIYIYKEYIYIIEYILMIYMLLSLY